MFWRRKQDIGSQPRANQISKVCKIAHLLSALILSSQQPNEKLLLSSHYTDEIIEVREVY